MHKRHAHSTQSPLCDPGQRGPSLQTEIEIGNPGMCAIFRFHYPYAKRLKTNFSNSPVKVQATVMLLMVAMAMAIAVLDP